MTTALIIGLVAVTLFFALRWRDASAELVELRGQVASLKRQLLKRTRP